MKFDSSYDRDKAKRFAASLRSRSHRTEIPKPAANFEQGVGLPSAPVPQASFADADIYRQDVLNELLDWSLTTKGMARALLTDIRGLVVAERGEEGDWNTDRLAGQLAEGLEILARAREGGELPDFLVWNSGEWWIGATRLKLPGEPLVLGLLSRYMIAPPVLSHMRELFTMRLQD